MDVRIPRPPRHGPQDRARPKRWQSCLGRLPKPPENAKIAFRWGWHKLEMTQPLKRPAQTHQPPPAPASSIETSRCWLGTTPSRRPVGTAYDRARIGTRTARTSPERISGPRLSRRGAQAGGGLPTIESCYIGDSIAASKMRFSPSSPPGTNLRCAVHS